MENQRFTAYQSDTTSYSHDETCETVKERLDFMEASMNYI